MHLIEHLKKYADGNAEVAQEYLRFLQLKFHDDDDYSNDLAPSLLIDAVWQKHISDTRCYTTDCHQLFGKVMRRHDTASSDATSAYQRTLRVYEVTYNTSPPTHIWPSVQKSEQKVLLKYTRPCGAGLVFKVCIEMTVIALKTKLLQYEKFEGHPSTYQLLHNNVSPEYHPSATLREMNMQDGDIITLAESNVE